jgi:hypothetical protein
MWDSTEGKLLRIEPSPQGRIAVIALSGEIGRPFGLRPVFLKTGEVRVNIDKETVLAQRVELRRADEVQPGGSFNYDVTRIEAEARFSEDTGRGDPGSKDQATTKEGK